MRLILSRKGFDSASGGCPNPLLPDGSMIALPIPDMHSPVQYADVTWRGRNLGDVVEALTKSKQRRHYRAHLDPDLRRDAVPRERGWRPLFGQMGASQGHLQRQGAGLGDLFLFFGLFRPVNDELRWRGKPLHVIWGWLQVGEIARVDDIRGSTRWRWAARHPHLAFGPDKSNTIYVASTRLRLRGLRGPALPGAGTFNMIAGERRLTAADAANPSDWKLPLDFLPRGRSALSYHGDPARWSKREECVRLRAVGRGQEFVLDLERYPGVRAWLASLFRNGV